MKLPLIFGVVVFVVLSCAAAPDYTVTILDRESPAALYRPEYEASTKLVGKNIAAIFGPLSEVRVELGAVNVTDIDGDTKKVKQKIRERIDYAKCLGHESEVAWHQAPWVDGYILFKNGRILPVRILLDAVVIGDLLFAGNAEPSGATNGASPRR